MTVRPRTFLASACALLTLVGLGAGFGFDPAGDPVSAASMYIAPENALIFRMRQPDGSFRQFEREVAKPDRLRGADGWTGRLAGERIVIRTPSEFRPAVVYCFERGSIRWYSCDGKTNDLSSVGSQLLPAESSPLNYPNPAEITDRTDGPRFDLWRNRQRLQFPFLNPNRNGVLYAQLLLIGLALLLVTWRRRLCMPLGCVVSVFSCFALLMTASRGAFLAAAVAVLPVLAFKGRRFLSSRWLWIGLAVVVAFGSIWFATHDKRLLTRGFKKTSWSNRIRMDLAKAAPRMMADAPGGWGFFDAGHAYVNWYQPNDVWCLTGSMMNDHLTVAVSAGRPVRMAYVFGWLLVLAFLTRFAFQSRNAIPLGCWTSMATAATFNPVMGEGTLWLLPAAALGYALLTSVRTLRARKTIFTVLGAVVLAIAAVLAVEQFGRGEQRGVPIHADGHRVLVNGLNPKTWIVDDGVALAGPLAGKDVRAFYETIPHAPAVGYVRRVEDLPCAGIQHLVLAGYAGDAWLRKVSASPELQNSLPPRVTFISPPFPPQALPPPLLESTKIRVLVGEFVARYGDTYANPPDWVTLVPGSEFYLLRWMSHVWQVD